MATHSSTLLSEKSHGQRSLVDYSPWGHKESDTTERLRAWTMFMREDRTALPLVCVPLLPWPGLTKVPSSDLQGTEDSSVWLTRCLGVQRKKRGETEEARLRGAVFHVILFTCSHVPLPSHRNLAAGGGTCLPSCV